MKLMLNDFAKIYYLCLKLLKTKNHLVMKQGGLIEKI